MKHKKIIIRVLLIIISIFLLVILGFEMNFLKFAKNHAIFISKADSLSVIDDNAKYIQTSNVLKTNIYELDNNKYKKIKFSEKITGATKCNSADSFIVSNSKGTEAENLGCATLNGKIFIPIKYSKIEYKVINNKILYVCNLENEETTIYDSKGKKIYHSKNYTIVMSYNNELRFIEQKNDKFGIYDKDKKIILNFEYRVSNFYKDKYIISINKKNKYGVIDANGNVIIDYKYDNINPLKKIKDNSKNIYIVGTEYEEKSNIPEEEINSRADYEPPKTITKYQLLDEQGNKTKTYDEIVELENKTFCVCLNNKWGIIDYSFNILLPIENKQIPNCVKMKNKRYFIIDTGNSKYLKDENLKDVIPQGKYNKITPVSDYLFAVENDDGFGIVDLNNKIIASPQYDSSTDESDNGYVILKDGKSNTIVDKKGNIVFKQKCKSFYSYKNGLAYTGNLIFGKYIDEKGNTVIPSHINKDNKFSLVSKVSPCFKTSCYENDGDKLVKIEGIKGYYILKI